MKLFIIKYLLFSILLSGTVMPVHAYAYADDCPPTDEKQLTVDTEKQSDTQEASCDHCCHFSSHFVGLFKTSISDELSMKGALTDDLSYEYRFLIAAPPYHPPILI